MRARSRAGGGIGATVRLTPITLHVPASARAPSGDAIFAASAPAPNPTCPPGQHWEDTPTTLKGLGDCVPDAPTAAAAPLPAAVPASTVPVQQACAQPWSLWWLVVAACAGAFVGHYAAKNQKAAKKNAGRIANLAATRVVNAGVARLLG